MTNPQLVRKALQEEELQWSNVNTILDEDKGASHPVRLRWIVGNPDLPLRAVTVALTGEDAEAIARGLLAQAQAAREVRGGVILASPADIDPAAKLFNGNGKPTP